MNIQYQLNCLFISIHIGDDQFRIFRMNLVNMSVLDIHDHNYYEYEYSIHQYSL